MSALDSGLAPVRMPEHQLPVYAQHHIAKHKLLAHYMNVWLAKLAQTYPRTVLIDGFASAGRYRGGERGSPLIMLDAFVKHSARERFRKPPHFVFIESRRDFAQNLKAEVEAYSDLYGAQVDVIHGEYEATWQEVLDWLCLRYLKPLPTFALIDPRGYSQTPFAHITTFKRQLPQNTEVMVYLPVHFMARFADTGQVSDALTRQYGDRRWLKAFEDEATVRETSDNLGQLFADGLREHFAEVTSFRVKPKKGNAYQLLFATDHDDGLREMKRGYWKVDEQSGSHYDYKPPPPPPRDKRPPGQVEMFPVEAPPEPEPPEESADFEEVNAAELVRLLQGHFGDEVFAIEEAERFTLHSTPFLDVKHLRQWALGPLERAGKLDRIDWPVGKARTPGKYAAGARLRLL